MSLASAIAELARTRVGQAYVLGTTVPYVDPDYSGPWDCAELATWAVRQVTGQLVGVTPDGDAYSGAWATCGGSPAIVLPDPLPADPQRWTAPRGVDPAIAAGTPGAILVRAPSGPGLSGHVAISQGEGRTVEAYDTHHGVIESTSAHRRWTVGILVPGVEYTLGRVDLHAPSVVLRHGDRGPGVARVQAALVAHGCPCAVDGVYGPETAAAVVAFQRSSHLVPDGEVGPITAAALGLAL